MGASETMITWFTGQPGHGKTTLAQALQHALELKGVRAYHLDGDQLRNSTGNSDYSSAGRRSNVDRAQAIARFLHENEQIVLVSIVAPFKDQREEFKSSLGSALLEVYVHASVPREREQNRVHDYEPPTSHFLDLDTSFASVQECVDTITSAISLPSKEVETLDKQKTLAIDFDGVLHRYSRGFQGLEHAYDPPMEGTEEGLKRLKAEGFALRIMSSRPAAVIREWLDRYHLSHYFDDVRNDKFPATLYIDDRALHFTSWESLIADINTHPKLRK